MAKKTSKPTARRKKAVLPAGEPVETVAVVAAAEPQPAEKAKAVKKGEGGIDIVVPMVFASDEVWMRTYKEACEKAGIRPVVNERYRSWNLERYFFRGIEKFMPFVRNVHLIVSNEEQVPYWLDRSKVHVVLHKDIIPEDLLPTFNSSTIEMWLHNIEGLSETFVYCNDDMIAVAPMTAEDFFVDGKPVTRCDERRVPISGVFLEMVRQEMELIGKEYGKTFDEGVTLRDSHSYSPQLLSVLRETVEKYGDVMKASCTPFREGRNMNQYIYTYRMWLGGMCTGNCHTHKYYNISYDYDKMEKEILGGGISVACFNDSGTGSWYEAQQRIYGVLQKVLGEKSGFEV